MPKDPAKKCMRDSSRQILKYKFFNIKKRRFSFEKAVNCTRVYTSSLQMPALQSRREGVVLKIFLNSKRKWLRLLIFTVEWRTPVPYQTNEQGVRVCAWISSIIKENYLKNWSPLLSFKICP